MVRQNRLIERNALWEPQAFPTTDPGVLEETWRNWAIHEAIKRYLIVFCLKVGASRFSCVGRLQCGLLDIYSRSSTSYILLLIAVVLARGIFDVPTM